MKILLIAYDNGSHISYFPLNIGYIAAALRDAGHEVKIYQQDIQHYPDEHLTAYLDNNTFDAVGLGVIGGYYQYLKLLSLSKAVNASKNRPFYFIGGHGPSPEPEYFLRKTGADVACIGEGEITVVELMEYLVGQKKLEDIDGIAYFADGKFCRTAKRQLINDIDSISWPAYELFPMEIYRLVRRDPNLAATDFALPIISGRGCKFKCTFCYRMDDGYRQRDVDDVIAEIKFLNEKYSINYFSFWDELFWINDERVLTFCDAFEDNNLKIKWNCQGRLNYVNSKTLRRMKEAGCVYINYGIESLDNQVLKNYRKGLNDKMIIEGIEKTLEVGISPGLNIIFGNIGDNRKTIEKSVDFLLKYNDGAEMRTIRPVTPYPGCELYYKAIQMGLLKDCADFYENKHSNSDLLTVNFTDMSDEEFYQAMLWANSVLIEDYQKRAKEITRKQLHKLYVEKDVSFRGFRTV